MTGLNHLSKSWKAWRSNRCVLQAIVRPIPEVRQQFEFYIWYHRRPYSREDRITFSLANQGTHRNFFVACSSKVRWCQLYKVKTTAIRVNPSLYQIMFWLRFQIITLSVAFALIIPRQGLCYLLYICNKTTLSNIQISGTFFVDRFCGGERARKAEYFLVFALAYIPLSFGGAQRKAKRKFYLSALSATRVQRAVEISFKIRNPKSAIGGAFLLFCLLSSITSR